MPTLSLLRHIQCANQIIPFLAISPLSRKFHQRGGARRLRNSDNSWGWKRGLKQCRSTDTHFADLDGSRTTRWAGGSERDRDGDALSVLGKAYLIHLLEFAGRPNDTAALPTIRRYRESEQGSATKSDMTPGVGRGGAGFGWRIWGHGWECSFFFGQISLQLSTPKTPSSLNTRHLLSKVPPLALAPAA